MKEPMTWDDWTMVTIILPAALAVGWWLVRQFFDGVVDDWRGPKKR